MAAQAADVAGFPRSARRTARAQGRYLGLGFATFSERTGYGTPAFAARGMEVTPGWETVELAMDPSGFDRGAHRRIPARPGPAHHAGANHCRRAWHVAGAHQDRARRYRPHALWLGHLCQPLAGDRRRRHADGGAKGAREAQRRWQPSCSKRRPTTSCSKPMPRASPAPIAPSRCRRWRAPPITRSHRFKGEITPGISESATYDPPGHLLQCLSCRHGRG